MNRVIKFRGISIDTDELVFGDVLIDGDDSYIFPKNAGWFELRSNLIRVPTSTVEQFTGLHDKNGKEIYEGDICAFQFGAMSGKVEIVFYDGAFRLSGYPFDDFNILETGERVEIIGNIYQNPELL